MARLIAALLRHGEYQQPDGVPSAHLPHPLTPAGAEQADQAAHELIAFAQSVGSVLDGCIHTSRMLRAWQTATKMSEVFAAHGIVSEVVEVDALAERCVGCLANLSITEIEAVAARDPRVERLPLGWKRRSDYRLPFQGAESLLEAGERVARHLEQSLARSGRETAADILKVFVGHGGAFRHAAAHLNVLSLEELPQLSMDHCRAVFIERIAPRVWQHIGGEWIQRSSSSRRFD